MSVTNLNNYYSAGYFLIRANKPFAWHLPKDLFPDQLISLSRCICPKLELSWGWNNESANSEKRSIEFEDAVDFGIPADRYKAFVDWCKHEYAMELDYWSMFYSTEAARRFIKRFIVNTQNLYLMGVGFPRDIEEIGWRGEKTDDEDYGVKKRIKQHLSLEPGGEVLGHEIVSFEYGHFNHSWVCGSIYEEPFGFSLNQRGLISSLDDARKVYDWIAEDEMKGTRGEPEPYYIWLLVSYPLFVAETD